MQWFPCKNTKALAVSLRIYAICSSVNRFPFNFNPWTRSVTDPPVHNWKIKQQMKWKRHQRFKFHSKYASACYKKKQHNFLYHEIFNSFVYLAWISSQHFSYYFISSFFYEDVKHNHICSMFALTRSLMYDISLELRHKWN